MKRKLFLILCVSAIVASCSMKEQVETTTDNAVLDRAQIDLVINSTIDQPQYGEATKTGWEKGDGTGRYYWESNDVLGAALLDGAVAGTCKPDNIVTNYPFAIKEMGEGEHPVTALFQTPTAVYVGTYVFYHNYNKSLVSGRVLSYELPQVQYYNPADPYKHLTDKNFWVSPLVKFVDGIEYGEANSADIKFTSMYSGLGLNMTNTFGAPVKIYKVEVVNSGTDFVIGGNVNADPDPDAFGAVIPSDADDFSEQMETSRAALQAFDRDLNITGSEAKVSRLTLRMKDDAPVEVATGASLDLRMLVPAGTWAASNVSVIISTDKGQKIFTNTAAHDLNRDRYLVFDAGLNSFIPYENFDIYNEADWQFAVNVINSDPYYMNHIATFTLKDNVDIVSSTNNIPRFSIYVKSDPSSAYKLNLATAADQTNSFTFAPGSYFESVVVEEGCTLNLNGTSFFNDLENNGTVVVPANKEVLSQSNYDYATWKTTPIYGVATFTNNNVINVSGRLAFANAIPADASVTINEGGAFVVVGTTTVENNGIITNNGTIDILLSTASLTNKGTLNNNEGATIIVNGTDIINEKLMNIDKASKVQTKEDPASHVMINNAYDAAEIVISGVSDEIFVDKDGNSIDIAMVLNLDSSTGEGTTSVVVSSDDEAVPALTDLPELNSVTLTGDAGWAEENLQTLDLANVPTITRLTIFSTDIDIYFADLTSEDQFTAIENITVKGECAINNTDPNDEVGGPHTSLFASVLKNLTIDSAAKLTIDEYVVIGVQHVLSATVANVTVLGEVIINGSLVANNLVIGATDNTVANVTINTTGFLVSAASIDASDVDLFVATGLIHNYGTLENKANLYAAGVDNKVVGVSKFIGNITGVATDPALMGVIFY